MATMKTAAVAVLLILGLLPSWLDAGPHVREGFCNRYKAPPKSCEKIYKPICGSDGLTYTNECYFCANVFRRLGSLCFAYYGRC